MQKHVQWRTLVTLVKRALGIWDCVALLAQTCAKNRSIVLTILLFFFMPISSQPTPLFRSLDSFTAESVVGTLRELANQQRTVVATIHQPNSEISRMFHRVCCPGELGGPSGQSKGFACNAAHHARSGGYARTAQLSRRPVFLSPPTNNPVPTQFRENVHAGSA